MCDPTNLINLLNFAAPFWPIFYVLLSPSSFHEWCPFFYKDLSSSYYKDYVKKMLKKKKSTKIRYSNEALYVMFVLWHLFSQNAMLRQTIWTVFDYVCNCEFKHSWRESFLGTFISFRTFLDILSLRYIRDDQKQVRKRHSKGLGSDAFTVGTLAPKLQRVPLDILFLNFEPCNLTVKPPQWV